VPLESGPHTVHGVTFDLSSYSSWLLDGFATFGVNAHKDDGYSIDYARLTIEGILLPPVAPVANAGGPYSLDMGGSVVLGGSAVGGYNNQAAWDIALSSPNINRPAGRCSDYFF
jgi:hypothetical protein